MIPSQISLIAHITKIFPEGTALLPRQMNAIIEGANLIIAELKKPYNPSVVGEGFHKWCASDDTGLSSLWLARYLCGVYEGKFAYPHDAADFNRCIKMLSAVPEALGNFHKLKDAPAPWPALWEEWHTLVQLLAEKSEGELFRKIQSINNRALGK